MQTKLPVLLCRLKANSGNCLAKKRTAVCLSETVTAVLEGGVMVKNVINSGSFLYSTASGLSYVSVTLDRTEQQTSPDNVNKDLQDLMRHRISNTSRTYRRIQENTDF